MTVRKTAGMAIEGCGDGNEKPRHPRVLFIEDLLQSVAELISRHAERDPRSKHCEDDGKEDYGHGDGRLWRWQ